MEMFSVLYQFISIYNINTVAPQLPPLPELSSQPPQLYYHSNVRHRKYQLGPKARNPPNKLGLTRLQPHHFTSIAEVIDLHLGQLMHFLHRVVVTEQQYKSRTIKLNLHNFRRFLFHAMLNWITVILLLLVTFFSSFSTLSMPNFLTGFTAILGEALQIGADSGHQIALFTFVLAATLTLQDDAALYSLYLALTYQSTKLDVMYELRASLDRDVLPEEKEVIINYFVFFSYLAGLANKAAAISLIGCALELFATGIKLYLTGLINLAQLITGTAISFAVQLLFFEMLFDFFTLFTGLFWVVKIFRLKLDQILKELCLFRQKSNQLLFERFYAQYLALHRLILHYNITAKRYIQNLDIASKFLTSLIIIYVIKRRDKKCENLFFSYLFLALYLIIYAYDMAMHFRLATFQSRQKTIYRQLSSVVGALVFHKRKKLSRRALRFRWKLNGAVEFAGGNRLGFTLGRLYLIEPIKVVTSFTLNLYMLILLAEKVRI